MSRKMLYLIILALVLTTWSFAQPIDNGYQKLIDDFFALYVKGEPVQALDQLYATNPWIKSNPDDVAKVKSGLSGLSSLVGEYISHDLLETEQLGPRFVDVEYVVNCDRQPLRFHFQFYKPRNVKSSAS